ncbi:MAG: type II toxin-antitoxin system VapC family toxin [Spirochaetia bacterium]
MKYWDSSALISLLVDEPESESRTSLLQEDSQVITWWGSRVECASALNRLQRERSLDEGGLIQALSNLEAFYETCVEVLPSEEVRKRAIRLLRVHPLLAADALQLAAALLAAREDPSSLALVTSDDKLRSAANREGFLVL